MNLVTTFDQYNSRYIFFLDAIKNTVIPNSSFIRIYYSNSNFTLNGIYLIINFVNTTTEKYYNKFKCNFNKNDNMQLIHNLYKFENEILEKYPIKNKFPQNSLFNQINQGSMKIFADSEDVFQSNMKFILKVSGIWENENEYGITYKFIPIHSS